MLVRVTLLQDNKLELINMESNMSKPILAQLYAARARYHWANGNKEQAEEFWKSAKACWYSWRYNND